MDPVYSCTHRPHNFTVLHPNRKFPLPKSGNTYKWHISNLTPDMDKFKVIHAFEKAFSIWQRGIDRIEPIGEYLNFDSTKNIEEADMIFTFGGSGIHTFPDADNKIHECPFNFDGIQGVLAHAWSLQSSKPFGGQMHLDENENWSQMHGFDEEGKFFTHLLTVVIHEIGHILGIGHSEFREAMMFPSYNGIKTQLHEDDLAAAQATLGPVKVILKDQEDPSPEVTQEDLRGCRDKAGFLLLIILALSQLL